MSCSALVRCVKLLLMCAASSNAAVLVQIVSPLGIGAVALAASSQLTPQRLLVDEYTCTGSNFVLAQPATELAAYLHKRWVSLHALCTCNQARRQAGLCTNRSKVKQPGAMAGWAGASGCCIGVRRRSAAPEQVRTGLHPLSRCNSLTCALFAALRRSLNVALVPDVAAALAAAGGGRTGMPNSVAAAAQLRSMQSTNHVLMVAPTAFGFNEQAAQDNSFMHAATKAGAGSDLTRQVGPGCSWCGLLRVALFINWASACQTLSAHLCWHKPARKQPAVACCVFLLHAAIRPARKRMLALANEHPRRAPSSF